MTTTLTPPQAANGNGGEIQAAKPPTTLTLGEMLAKRRDMIAAVLPKHLAPERLIKLATMAVGRDPKLSKATALSIVNAVVKAAELGLDCSGTLGSAYLVAYDNNKKDDRGNWYKQTEAQLIIGYRGLIDLARRSGQIASIEARVVWSNDQFEFEYGLEPRLRHIPALDKDPGELRLVYGIAKLRDGAIQVEVMTKAEIDRIKGRSKSGNNEKSPWSTDYPEMARKTVVKRLCKYLPLSVEVQEVIAEDNVADPIDANDAREMVDNGGAARGIAGLNKKITSRPVSEGQTLEPTPEALQEAANDGAAQQPSHDLPSDNEAPENGDEGAEAEAIKIREALEDADDAKRNLYAFAQSKGATKAKYESALFKWLQARNVGDISKSTFEQRLELWNEIAAGTFPAK